MNTELDKAPDTQAPAIIIRFLCSIFFACIAGKGAKVSNKADTVESTRRMAQPGGQGYKTAELSAGNKQVIIM